jgi:hypothetical protein
LGRTVAQSSLFAEEELSPKRYTPNPQHIRNRLEDLLDEMQAADRWPWDGAVLSLYRDNVLPRLCEQLPDQEAARWRAEIEVQVRRLDSLA